MARDDRSGSRRALLSLQIARYAIVTVIGHRPFLVQPMYKVTFFLKGSVLDALIRTGGRWGCRRLVTELTDRVEEE